LLVANHISNHDPTLMALAFPKGRHIYPMAKQELFGRFEWAYRYLGAFPIYRGGVDTWAFEHVGKILGAGQICTVYAEGSRSGREKVELRRAKTGAARLAVQHQVPILPCAIIGTEKIAMRQQFKGWRPITVKVSLGNLIDVPKLVPQAPDDQLVYRELTDQIMYELAQLLPVENRGYYAEKRTVRRRKGTSK
jgi:1-acyl-sn-glycerol-3-phosphate acyltransferase